MPQYRFRAVNDNIIYEMEIYAKNFRADSSGHVGFFDHSGNLIRMFEPDEIDAGSITKVSMEDNRG